MGPSRMCIIDGCLNFSLETKDTCAGHIAGHIAVAAPTAPRNRWAGSEAAALRASEYTLAVPQVLGILARDLRTTVTSLNMLLADVEQLAKNITLPEGFALQLPKVLDVRPKALKKAKTKGAASRRPRVARKSRTRRSHSR